MGADYPAEQASQENLGFFLRVLVQTWKNSIGDAGPPAFSEWEQMRHIHYKESLWPNFYIFLIWMFFFFNQLFIAVILLNFLIAMITQSYERVMQQRAKSHYAQKCDLNIEIKLLQSHLMNEKKFDSVIIFSRNDLNANEEDDEENWDGFVEAIRKQLHLYFGQVDNRLQNIDLQVKHRQDAMDKKLDAAMNQLSNLSDDFKNFHNLLLGIHEQQSEQKKELKQMHQQSKHASNSEPSLLTVSGEGKQGAFKK